MNTIQEQIKSLYEKLEYLQNRQNKFNVEIVRLTNEIHQLEKLVNQQQLNVVPPPPPPPPKAEEIKINPIPEIKSIFTDPEPEVIQNRYDDNQPSGLEKLIGENIINKIGIAITIIGVAIGTKYSIEHQLMSPAMRITLGYILSLAMLFTGYRLKSRYLNYSAVLVSGAITIMYLLTYAAHNFFHLIPLPLAFGLMVLFTIGAVYAAIQYNKQIIAHIALVGAYAVPFLLREQHGSYQFLFMYIVIINIGILTLSFKKYWKPLYISAFFVTWLIYGAWYSDNSYIDNNINIPFCFITITFGLFYTILIAFRHISPQKQTVENNSFILLNGLLFYLFGVLLLEPKLQSSEHALFALINMGIHAGVSYFIYKKIPENKQLFYFITGIALTFLTLAIPLQFDNYIVVVLWALLAATVFFVGRKKGIIYYEQRAYFIMLLSVLAILRQFSTTIGTTNLSLNGLHTYPFFNVYFSSGLLFTGIYIWLHRYKTQTANDVIIFNNKEVNAILHYFIPFVIIASTYFLFYTEIDEIFERLSASTARFSKYENNRHSGYHINTDITVFKQIALVCYTFLFFAVSFFLNKKFIKQISFYHFNLFGYGLITVLFILVALHNLHNLINYYVDPHHNNAYTKGPIYIIIRYITYLCFAIAAYSFSLLLNTSFLKLRTHFAKILFEWLLHFSILCASTGELIGWLQLTGQAHTDKVALSILWGLYALMLIMLGIWKHKQYLRISAIALLGITLIKLLFYDLRHLDTIGKTIVFVVLGVLLLLVSFLYNKYRSRINPDRNEDVV